MEADTVRPAPGADPDPIRAAGDIRVEQRLQPVEVDPGFLKTGPLAKAAELVGCQRWRVDPKNLISFAAFAITLT